MLLPMLSRDEDGLFDREEAGRGIVGECGCWEDCDDLLEWGSNSVWLYSKVLGDIDSWVD